MQPALLAITFTLMAALTALPLKLSAEDPIKAAYFFSGGATSASDVNATLFTHLIYAFLNLDPTTFHVSPSSGDETNVASFTSTVRAENPSIKTLVSIGGGSSNATAFAEMAATAVTRAAFISSTIAFARAYGFDGLDLDWQGPESETDMANLALLLSEWRTAVKANGSTPLLLSAAVYYNVTHYLDGLVTRTFPTAAISEYLDFVTIMAYDLHGSWEKTPTAEHTALYDNTTEQMLTVNYGVQNWISAGLDPSKACLGLAAYGYQWFLQNSSINGVGAPATDSDSSATFSDIMSSVQSYNGSCKEDNVAVAAYCYWEDSSSGKTVWAGFDNPNTIAAKVRYLKNNGLRGYSFWSVAGDIQGLLFQRASNTLPSSK